MGTEIIRRLFRRAAFAVRARHHAAELAAELEEHRARVQQTLEQDGVPAAEAAARSRRAMGNMTLAREDARDVWIVGAIDRVWRDLKYGARGLRREPLFTIAASLTLALGMALTTTAFSVADAELWKPLPFPRPQELVAVYPTGPGGHASTEYISGADYLDWRLQAAAAAGGERISEQRPFGDLAGVGETRRRVLHRTTAESILVTSVTWNYFALFGRAPLLGRGFTEEDAPGARAAVLTARGWRRLVNADPAVLGRTWMIDAQPVSVVGVVRGEGPADQQPDAYVVIDTGAPGFRDRAGRAITSVVGRLGPGIDAGAARAEMQAIVARIARSYPAGRTGWTMHVDDLKEFSSGNNWRPLYFFLYAAGLVLLLASVNTAGLVLARALRRDREFALRSALGGGRAAMLRQLLVEGSLLAISGAAIALLLTNWALGLLARVIPPDYLVRGEHVPIDTRVALAAFIFATLAAVICGLLPALFAGRSDLGRILGQGGRVASASPGQARARHLLLGAELALTVVLLAAAGLFLRSFVALTHVPLGFEPRDAIALRVTPSGPRYASNEQIRGYAAEMLARARAVPGVRAAAVGNTSPLGSGNVVRFIAPDRARPSPGEEPSAIIRAATPGYFETLGIQLVTGRAFGAADVNGAPRVAVVNETLARRIFPGENALGRVIAVLPGGRSPWTRQGGELLIVGVAHNIREVGLNEVDFNDLYVPFVQMTPPTVELVVRTSVPARTALAALRAAVETVDPSIPVSSVTTFEERVGEALRQDRFHLVLVASFAAAALLLAAIGIFGAVGYAVQERTREFGVRIALGAPSGAILRSALGRALHSTFTGVAIGVAATLVLARAVIGNALYLVPGEHNGLLFGVTTTDPVALSAAMIVVVSVAVFASLLPARHATRVDPLVALRTE